MLGLEQRIINVQLYKCKKMKYLKRKQAGVARHDYIAKVFNVLRDPWQIGGFLIHAIAVFGQRVALLVELWFLVR